MKNALWVIIAIVLIGGGYWWYTSNGVTAPVGALNENAPFHAPVGETPAATTPTHMHSAAPTPLAVTYDVKTY